MVLIRQFETPRLYRNGFVSIGNFDGVHLGHQQIVRRLAECARRAEAPAVVMTFDPHPLTLLRPDRVPPSLTTLEHKAELLEKAGATCVVAYPTDRKLLQLTPAEFFDAVIVAELRAKGVVEGPNFCFGKDRKGDIGTLRDLCQSRSVELEVVEPVGEHDQMVSSSAIRSLIENGRLAEAVELLGHPYRLAGDVVTGANRGRAIGFPTANLTRIGSLLPADGVYAGAAVIDGRRFAAAINVGPNPTFDEGDHKVEAHLLGFSGDLYGRRLNLDFFKRIRGVQRFEGRDQLVSQIREDVAAARACLQIDAGGKTG